MDSRNLTTYYLCGDSVPEHSFGGFLCFTAQFAESCKIKNCYIIAVSLNDAMSILYSKLAPIWTAEYLDNNLLSISFSSNLSYV